MDRQDFLSAVLNLITSNYPEDKARGLKASEVGLLVRSSMADTSWAQFGFPKLKDVLSELERQGQIRTGIDAKFAYSVWIGEEKTRDPMGRSVPPSNETPRFRPLRKPVWTAFVTDKPRGKRFLSKSDGTVRMGLPEESNPDSDWVEMIPVTQDVQRSWARDFLKQNEISDQDGFLESLESEFWYHDFVEKLRADCPDRARAWLRVRSSKIVQVVQEWTNREGIPQDLVFEALQPFEKRVPTRGAGRYSDLRGGLIAAVESLTTDELLHLSIPARTLLAVFRPDLLASGIKSSRQS